MEESTSLLLIVRPSFRCAIIITGDHDEGLVNPSPTYFPEKLRLALMLFQSSHEDLHAQLDAARSQLSSVQGGMEQVTMECATSKESLSEKSVALVVRPGEGSLGSR